MTGSLAFISYSRKDSNAAQRLQSGLEEAGISVSIDKAEIRTGEDWWNRLHQVIVEADSIICVVSPNYLRSTICEAELKLASSLNKRILPFLIVDPANLNMPTELAKINYIILTEEAERFDFERALQKVVSAIRTDLGWIREHTYLTQRATRWSNEGRPAGQLLRGRALSDAKRWLALSGADGRESSEIHRDYIEASLLNERLDADFAKSAIVRQYILRLIAILAAIWLGLKLIS